MYLLNFSVGSYHEAVLPTVDEWIAHGMRGNGEDIKICEVLPSFDENQKHLETINSLQIIQKIL